MKKQFVALKHVKLALHEHWIARQASVLWKRAVHPSCLLVLLWEGE